MMKVLITLAFVLPALAHADFEFDRTDFKHLFNKHRYGEVKPQPWPGTYWPYDGKVDAGHGKSKDLGSGINHRLNANEQSPAEKYDLCFDTKAVKWEEEEHTCNGIGKDEKQDCETWYGHCNGWTGAGLYNIEPDYGATFTPECPTGKSVMFNYMDIKALESELWMDVWASYEGTGMTEDPGPWIWHPNSQTALATASNNNQLNNYEAYWDVSPRQLFYVLTNYVGAQHLGIALDRFTGAEIWNQPLVGYRFLPLLENSGEPEEVDGKKLYPVTIGLKLYWANDEVGYDFKRGDSAEWSIENPKFSSDRAPNPPTDPDQQDRTKDDAVRSRYIAFILYFDEPVESKDGIHIKSAGKIKGDGLWLHAIEEQKKIWYPKDYKNAQLHPDFIWRPDHLVAPASFGNKYITPENLYVGIMGRKKGDVKRFLSGETE